MELLRTPRPIANHDRIGQPRYRPVCARPTPTFVMLVLAAAFGPVGCTHIQRPDQADQADKIDVDELLHEQLQAEPMVTVAETCRVMLVLADGEDPYNNHEERTALLEQRGIIRPEWQLQREDCIDNGTVAYMVCKILKRRGGVNRELFGNLGIGDRRYAIRELVYMELMSPAPPYRYISGAELVDLVGKADRYMADHQMYVQKPVDIVQSVDELSESTLPNGTTTKPSAP